jgi:crotonobetainyl-CoA:carnitine CoA-transferase CaiB-like acyl-CoA transferase
MGRRHAFRENIVSEPNVGAWQCLAGIRVVELGSSVAAPYAAWILGAMGAEVVKIERPGPGDDARQWGKMFPDGIGSYFHALNRDKQSITVDMSSAEERDWLRTYCITEADVVIQNMRPGTVKKYGLDADTLRAGNPRLIYCNLGAFGNEGPLKDKPGYDPLMQAYGGLMTITGEEGRPPIRVGTSIIDMGTGMWCAIGILGALKRRDDTGSGCTVDASLYETAVGWMNNAVASAAVDPQNPAREGSGARGMAPYQAYECSDGHLIIAAPNDRLFERLSQVLGHPEWPQDPRFDTNQNRYANLAELNALIEPVVLTRTRADWQQALDDAGIPSAPVQQTLEMMADPQTQALGILQAAMGSGPLLVGLPLSFDGTRPPTRKSAPTVGQHNDAIKGKTK